MLYYTLYNRRDALNKHINLCDNLSVPCGMDMNITL